MSYLDRLFWRTVARRNRLPVSWLASVNNSLRSFRIPFYQALRASLALRPAPNELIDRLIRSQRKSASGSDAVACGKEIKDHVLESARRFAGRSDRAADPNHDVLDLTWMAAGPLELRTVQELLEGLSAEVLPGTPLRFANYDEPRYRSALQLQLGSVSAPAANGGVLAEWPGRPRGVGAAHLRIFLEAWATVRSGHVVEFDRLPAMPRPGG